MIAKVRTLLLAQMNQHRKIEIANAILRFACDLKFSKEIVLGALAAVKARPSMRVLNCRLTM
jgi:hypothetical protein